MKQLIQMTAVALMAAGNLSADDNWREEYETEYRIRQIEHEQQRQADALYEIERHREKEKSEKLMDEIQRLLH